MLAALNAPPMGHGFGECRLNNSPATILARWLRWSSGDSGAGGLEGLVEEGEVLEEEHEEEDGEREGA